MVPMLQQRFVTEVLNSSADSPEQGRPVPIEIESHTPETTCWRRNQLIVHWR